MIKSLVVLNSLLLYSSVLAADGGHRNASSYSAPRHLRSQVRSCTLPENAQPSWHYHAVDSGHHICLGVAPNEFAMPRSYVHGGKENIHWKYTDNEDDPDCMKNWTHYDKDALIVKEFINSLAVSPGISPKSWCAMNVYRVGGLKDKQWQSCDYKKQTPTTGPDPTGLVPWTYGCSVSRRTTMNWYYNNDNNNDSTTTAVKWKAGSMPRRSRIRIHRSTSTCLPNENCQRDNMLNTKLCDAEALKHADSVD